MVWKTKRRTYSGNGPLALRHLGEGRLEGVSKLAADPLVVRYIGTGEPWPDERVQEFVARQMRQLGEVRNLPVEAAAERQRCADRDLRPAAPAGGPGRGNWLVAGAHRIGGKGLATEAARHALAYGFEVSNLERIVAIAQSANRDSLRVMDRIGMRFEREAVHKGIRVVLYAISREQFEAGKTKRGRSCLKFRRPPCNLRRLPAWRAC